MSILLSGMARHELVLRSSVISYFILNNYCVMHILAFIYLKSYFHVPFLYYPIFLEIKSRMLVFWYCLKHALSTGSNKMSCLMLKLITHKFNPNENNSDWLEHIYKNLDYLGLSYISNSQNLSLSQFKRLLKQKLKRLILTDAVRIYSF